MSLPTRPTRRRRALLALAAALAALVAAELVVRLAPETFGLPPTWNSVRAGAPAFEPRPHLLYAHRSGADGVNARGFRAPEWPAGRDPATLRIACLGASTTESGNDGGHPASYPFFLERGLDQLLEHSGSDRRVEVINLGMAGWTTAETLVHWFLAAKDLAPDLVLIHHAANDVAPRLWPGFRSDYAHYRRPWSLRGPGGPLAGSALATALLGAPPEPTLDDVVVRPNPDESGELAPEGRDAFRRNVASIARDAVAGGATVGLVTLPLAPRERFDAASLEPWRAGIAEHNAVLRELAAEGGFLLIDLAREAEAGHALLDGAWIDLVHLTPDGNLWKALAIGAALTEGWAPLAELADAR